MGCWDWLGILYSILYDMHKWTKYMIDGFTGKPSESDPQCILWNSRRLASRNGWGASYRRWRQDVGVTWGGVPGPSGNIFWRLGCQADYSGPLWSGARLGETLLGWQALIGGTGNGAFWLVPGNDLWPGWVSLTLSCCVVLALCTVYEISLQWIWNFFLRNN